jgi:GT2 family glycosyltransferase
LAAQCGFDPANVVVAASACMMFKVAVSILNYNSSVSTIACVQSLEDACRASNSEIELSIFVLDNGSAASDQAHLQESLANLPDVYVAINSVNRGFAAGHNENLNAIFLNYKPDYVWLLNNDCLVLNETLSQLIQSAQKHSEVGIWGATLLEPDGETIQCAGGCFYNSWLSSYRQYGRGKKLTQVDQLKDVDFDYIAGASLFFPVNVLHEGFNAVARQPVEAGKSKQQWLNEDFFLYFEELDLAKRLKPEYRMAWCKSALILHTGGASTGAIERQRTALAEYHSTLSALKFTGLYYPARLIVMAPVRYVAKSLQLLVTGKFRLIGSLTTAYRDFL